MTEQECGKLAALISLNYPTWHPANEKLLVQMWSKVLINDSYEAMELALIRYIRTTRNGFAPSIGQLMGCWDEIQRDLEGAKTTVRCMNESYGLSLEEPRIEQVAMGKSAEVRENIRRLTGC